MLFFKSLAAMQEEIGICKYCDWRKREKMAARRRKRILSARKIIAKSISGNLRRNRHQQHVVPRATILRRAVPPSLRKGGSVRNWD